MTQEESAVVLPKNTRKPLQQIDTGKLYTARGVIITIIV
jgi:hypothetical protein